MGNEFTGYQQDIILTALEHYEWELNDKLKYKDYKEDAKLSKNIKDRLKEIEKLKEMF